ncbi:MAG: molybdopterin-dependent oxidoreductase, partial [Pseudomonadota bacterium]
RGMKLVVIDPRETETARHADVFLQCRPGNDPAILAGITRQMIEDDLYDKAFVEAEADGFEALKTAVEPFTPREVADRADINPDDLIAAARAYGGADRGVVHAGTGPNMSGRGNLMEYFVRVLTTMRGGWLKAGDERRNPGVLVDPPPAIAASPGPQPAWGFGEELRVRGYTDTAVGLPCAALPDEILTPGEGRVRALICLGGNPMLAWPDQLKTFEAMKALDLLVCLDPRMSETGKLSDYVIAPKLQLEAAANTSAPEKTRAQQN